MNNISLILHLRNLRLREVTYFAQGHTANKWAGVKPSPILKEKTMLLNILYFLDNFLESRTGNF